MNARRKNYLREELIDILDLIPELLDEILLLLFHPSIFPPMPVSLPPFDSGQVRLGLCPGRSVLSLDDLALDFPLDPSGLEFTLVDLAEHRARLRVSHFVLTFLLVATFPPRLVLEFDRLLRIRVVGRLRRPEDPGQW